jgi:glycerol-3-phosphate dehydrogenase (NAD(P)+)
MKKIIVIGAGAWGTAIADLLAKNLNAKNSQAKNSHIKNSYRVFLIANDQNIIDEINYSATNKKFLPNVKLNGKIKALKDFTAEIKTADLVFIATPSANTAAIFTKISHLKIKKNCGFVICSKGLEHKSLSFLSDIFAKIVGSTNYAVLSGPNFAFEVAQEVPTITTVASKNKKLAKKVILALNNKDFCGQYFDDPRTIEICGIMKNIIAIGCGVTDELELGLNAKAALIMKGISEIQLLCLKFEAASSITHAAGFGDIFLTCSSPKSRNNLLGANIARGQTYREIVKKTGKTYEGALAAKAICALAKKSGLRLDLCEAINKILHRSQTPCQIKSIISKSILNNAK